MCFCVKSAHVPIPLLQPALPDWFITVRFSCNLYFRFFQCIFLIYVYKLKSAISALFWTVLVSVNQEFLYFYTDGVFTIFCTIKLSLGRRRPVLRSRAPIQKLSISDDFQENSISFTDKINSISVLDLSGCYGTIATLFRASFFGASMPCS